MKGRESKTTSAAPVEEVDRSSAISATPTTSSQQARKRNNEETSVMSLEDSNDCEWLWDSAARSVATSVVDSGREVRFHLEYSSGTAAIRGTKPLSEGHHYWEILMQSAVYGTDMMVGLGTASVQMDKYRNQFCSFLGIDEESWGLSYTGQVQHGGKSQSYTNKFSQGTIIGIHLDMWRGTLTFYKNKQNLGVAYTGLQGKSFYPMVCSTAARSSMKILNAVYFPSSLQFLCCETIRRIVPKQLDVTEVMAMPPGLRNFLHNNLNWLLQPCGDSSHRRQETLEEANSLMDLVRSTLGDANERVNDQSPSDSYDECCEGVTEFSLHCDADDFPLFPLEFPSSESSSFSSSSSSSPSSSEPNPKRAKDAKDDNDDKRKRPSSAKLSLAETKSRDCVNEKGSRLERKMDSVRASAQGRVPTLPHPLDSALRKGDEERMSMSRLNIPLEGTGGETLGKSENPEQSADDDLVGPDSPTSVSSASTSSSTESNSPVHKKDA